MPSVSVNVTESPDLRRIAVFLGYTGIIPMFVSLLFLDSKWASDLLKFYSLAIIAFLCGGWWATALISLDFSAKCFRQKLVGSNAIVIVAAFSSALLGHFSFAVIAIAFGCLLYGEYLLGLAQDQSKGYRDMRVRVTAAVIAIHLIAFWWSS